MANTNTHGDRYDTMAAELLQRHSVCGDVAAHDAANLQTQIAQLYRALAPFAEEAQFCGHGPGYIRRADWERARETMASYRGR